MLAQSTIMVVIVAMRLMLSEAAPAPAIPLSAVAMGNTALSGVAGISDFVSKIRSMVGRSGEFVDRNHFEYGQVYNAILQYSVIQAFEQGETNKLLVKNTEEMEKFHQEMAKSFYAQLSIGALLLVGAILTMRGNQRMDQNVNVVRQ